MKTKFILFILLLVSGMMSAQVKRVAILETVDKENKVSYANKLILRANLSKAITQTSGYEAYDRTDIDAIMGEQNFQRTGLVSNDQIKRLGEMTGANYILVAEAVVVDSKNMFITAKLLDVETARTIMTDNVMMGTTTEAIQKGCVTLAKKMFHEESIRVVIDKEEKQVIQKQEQPEKAKVELVPAEIQLVHHSKKEQKLLGVQAYSYGDSQMDKKAYETFLLNNNTKVFKKYVLGKACISAGWSLFAIGSAATITGGILLAKADTYDELIKNATNISQQESYLEKQNLYYYYGDIVLYSGIGLTAVSIPLFTIGHVIVSNTPQQFNKQNMVQADLSLNLQASQNGIGLALNF